MGRRNTPRRPGSSGKQERRRDDLVFRIEGRHRARGQDARLHRGAGLGLLAGLDLGAECAGAEHLHLEIAAGPRLDQRLEVRHRRRDLVVVQILRQQMRDDHLVALRLRRAGAEGKEQAVATSSGACARARGVRSDMVLPPGDV
jgi:hypothetical protein